ncbi:rutB [Symbiodinium microadriaticum]|nr:rutB [Symbiodinium microadriaticum]
MAVRAFPPWPLDGCLEPDKTALLAIDMQIDFCGKGGYVDSMGYDISMTRAPIEPLKVVFQALRQKGYHIIHTREGHKPSLADCPDNKRWRSRQIGAGIGDPGPCGRVLVRGEPGWNLIEELQPAEGEEVLDKPGKGSFVATDLHLILQKKRIKKLIFAGITTDVCVSTTMREANDLGYDCLLLSDCTAATDYGNYLATLKTTQAYGGALGSVASAADLLRGIGFDCPEALERNLVEVDLGNGIKVRMPQPPSGLGMPKTVSDIIVAPKTSVSKGAVAADPYAWPFDGCIQPAKTALLAMNFQPDFLAAEGGMPSAGYKIDSGVRVLETSAKVLRHMRDAGFRIVHARLGFARNLSDCPQRGKRFPAGAQGPLGQCLVRGEKGWEFLPEFTPLPDELVIEKCGHGAFHLTSLELGLQSLGVTHLVVMGVPTDVCVHTTLRQANDRGFECLLLSDCTGTTAQDTQLSALKQVKMQHGVFGAVATSEALLTAVSQLDTAQSSKRLKSS